jgi:flagellar assembly factor FliW
MNFAETVELETVAVEKENIVNLPAGLLGLEHIKKYVLLANPDEEPFHWLQVIDDPTLAFLVLSPFEVMPDYEPEFSDEDADFLGIGDASDALVFNIVTLRADGSATINLKGPIILNRRTLAGKQVVISNASKYSLQHPLPVAEETFN